MEQWILDKYKDSYPDQKYAFLGTVNWMKALAIIIKHTDFDSKINQFYNSVQRLQKDDKRELIVFDNLLMAYHNHASLCSLKEFNSSAYDVSRAAIISWYYSIYFAASAMIGAQLGKNFETHTSTANAWVNNLVTAKLVVEPFNYCLMSTVKKEVDDQIIKARNGNEYTVQQTPHTIDQAKGAILSYLSGSGKHSREKLEDKLLISKEFKDRNLKDFRKKEAQTIRDKALSKNKVGFLHQAFRYRGKVNYRDSLFLTYGQDNSDEIDQLLDDLLVVSVGFQKMCVSYTKSRLSTESWNSFESDLKNNSRLSIDIDYWK